MIAIRTAGLCVVAIFMAACGIKPPPPTTLPPPMPPIVDNSIVSVPVRISSASLRDEINNRLTTQHGDRSIYWVTGKRINFPGKVTIQIGVHRSGSAEVSAREGSLFWGVPVAINSGRVDWEVFGGSKHFDFGGGARLGGRTDLRITEGWGLSAKTTPQFGWTEPLWVDINPPIGHIKIDVSGWVTPKIDEKLSGAAEKIDERISALSTRPHVEKAWQALHQPVQLSQAPEIWLYMQPSYLGLSQPGSDAGDILVKPTLVAKLVARAGGKSESGHTPPPLPPNTGNVGAEMLLLNVQAQAPYTEINDILAREVAGKEFEVGGGRILVVNKATASPNGDQLGFRVDFKLKDAGLFGTSGRIFLTGKPKYDDVTRRITVSDFDYDLKTRNYLITVADWLLHERFVRELQSKLVFDVSSKIDPVRREIEKGLQGKEIASGVKLSAIVRKFSISDLFLGAEAITISAKTEGDARIDVSVMP